MCYISQRGCVISNMMRKEDICLVTDLEEDYEDVGPYVD